MLNIVTIHHDLMLVQLLEKVILVEADWYLLMHATNFENFKNQFPKRSRIDVAIIDTAEMVHIQALKALSTEVKIIVLSDIEVTIEALKAFHNRALGYISKAEFITQIPHNIKIVLAGGVLVSPIIARHLIDSLILPISQKRNNCFNLTPKEIEVIHLISMGHSYDKVASILGVTKNGVRFHIKNIYPKLNVNSRVDAVRKWNNQPSE